MGCVTYDRDTTTLSTNLLWNKMEIASTATYKPRYILTGSRSSNQQHLPYSNHKNNTNPTKKHHKNKINYFKLFSTTITTANLHNFTILLARTGSKQHAARAREIQTKAGPAFCNRLLTIYNVITGSSQLSRYKWLTITIKHYL